jgi:phosphate:Na+ symporter
MLWSVRLVRTGVERVALHQLRATLRWASHSPLLGGLSGMALALLLQSSTAVALMVASFLRHHGLKASVGLALILGADLGSALIARLLLLRPDALMAGLMVLGVVLFLRSEQHARRQLGRILIGLALIFVSLDLLAQATAPLRTTPWVDDVAIYLNRDLLSAFLVAAVTAWLMHSSVAAILLIATLAYAGLLTGTAGLAMVLGANLGGSLIAVGLTLQSPAVVRQVMTANLLLRGGGAALGLWLLTNQTGAALVALWMPDLRWYPQGAAEQVIWGHVFFNATVLVLGLILSPLALRTTRRLLSDPLAPASTLSLLDDTALSDPTRALGCARRELLRMGDTVEAMLRSLPALFEEWNEAQAKHLLAMEQDLDRMHFATKIYLSRLQHDRLTEKQSDEAATLISLAGHIEAAGDEASGTILSLAKRLHLEQKRFSPSGWKELQTFLDRVLVNTQKALDILMRPERDAARALLEEKDSIRTLEDSLQLSHLKRLQSGLETSVETSNMHQALLRSLKQVNSSMAMIAYPVLEENGDLRTTRLLGPS